MRQTSTSVVTSNTLVSLVSQMQRGCRILWVGVMLRACRCSHGRAPCCSTVTRCPHGGAGRFLSRSALCVSGSGPEGVLRRNE